MEGQYLNLVPFDKEIKFLNVKLFILDFDLEEKENNIYLFLEVGWDVNLFKIFY